MIHLLNCSARLQCYSVRLGKGKQKVSEILVLKYSDLHTNIKGCYNNKLKFQIFKMFNQKILLYPKIFSLSFHC